MGKYTSHNYPNFTLITHGTKAMHKDGIIYGISPNTKDHPLTTLSQRSRILSLGKANKVTLKLIINDRSRLGKEFCQYYSPYSDNGNWSCLLSSYSMCRSKAMMVPYEKLNCSLLPFYGFSRGLNETEKPPCLPVEVYKNISAEDFKMALADPMANCKLECYEEVYTAAYSDGETDVTMTHKFDAEPAL